MGAQRRETTLNLHPYPGNKARHAEWVISHLPEHECYVEPFAGAAGVLLNKPRSKIEVLNDADGDVVHFLVTLRDHREELVEWLQATPFSRELHDRYADAFYNDERPSDDVERAGQYFYLRYTQHGGKIHGVSGFARDAPHRSRAGQYHSKIEALDAFSARLSGVTIECMDALDVIAETDSPGTLFYLDPPYVGRESLYRENTIEHTRLHDVLVEIDGRCIVSYDSVPPIYRDTDAWTVAQKDSTHKIDNTDDTQKDAVEYLLMNFDADGQQLMSDAGQQSLTAFND